MPEKEKKTQIREFDVSRRTAKNCLGKKKTKGKTERKRQEHYYLRVFFFGKFF